MSGDSGGQSRGSANWWLAAGALFIGYYLGQGSATPTNQPAYAQTPPPILTSSATAPAATSTRPIVADQAVNEQEVADGGLDVNAFSDAAAATASTGDYDTANAHVAAGQGVEERVDPLAPVGAAAAGVAGTAAAATAPRTTYSAPKAPTQPSPAFSSGPPAYTYTPPATSYVAHTRSYAAPQCEGVGCYGVISTTTGLPRTTYVRGYTRKDGTYVRPHYRSRRR